MKSRRFDGAGYRIGVDIGGTFTDLVIQGADGHMATLKVPSTPPDFGQGIENGIRRLIEDGVEAGTIGGIVHATTLATNAILEMKGVRTAHVTTKGFRDVLEMRRLRVPQLYDLQYVTPPPLVPRRLRFEVAERIAPTGEVRRPLDESEVRDIAFVLKAKEVEAVSICFLHSYVNPTHEREAAEILREVLGDDVYISCSSEVLPEIREYERTSTVVVNAYIGPIMDRYLGGLERRFQELGLHASFHVMRSAGGTATAEAARRKPAYLIESGPAAGVIACSELARLTGHSKVISFDMGGTTAKAALIENAEPAQTSEFEVGAGINLSSKLVKGGGYAIKLPFLDTSEIGAGGGSIVQVDAAGSFVVGPQSAGAVPGPVCYDQGGTEPTLTDALVVLGYLSQSYLVAGEVPLNAALAREAFVRKIAEPLGLGLLDAARGALEIAVANMTRAVKAVSTYRGRDPRDFALVAFGGNGPGVGVEIARALQMSRVMVPPAPGVFSALGLLVSPMEHELIQTFFGSTDTLEIEALNSTIGRLRDQVIELFSEDGHETTDVAVEYRADLRYAGQAYELTIPFKKDRTHMIDLDNLVETFHEEHERTYGYRSNETPVHLVNVRVVGRATPQGKFTFDPRSAVEPGKLKETPAPRNVYFGRDMGARETSVVDRVTLSGEPRPGPLIIEEYDSTCVVPPGCRVWLDEFGNIVIDLDLEGQRG